MLTRFRVQPSYNSSALPNFVLDGNGEWVAYQDAMQAIATARAEALREAEPRLKKWLHGYACPIKASEYASLKNALYGTTDKQEGKNG